MNILYKLCIIIMMMFTFREKTGVKKGVVSNEDGL